VAARSKAKVAATLCMFGSWSWGGEEWTEERSTERSGVERAARNEHEEADRGRTGEKLVRQGSALSSKDAAMPHTHMHSTPTRKTDIAWVQGPDRADQSCDRLVVALGVGGKAAAAGAGARRPCQLSIRQVVSVCQCPAVSWYHSRCGLSTGIACAS
jgi:hypothetical protein